MAYLQTVNYLTPWGAVAILVSNGTHPGTLAIQINVKTNESAMTCAIIKVT